MQLHLGWFLYYGNVLPSGYALYQVYLPDKVFWNFDGANGHPEYWYLF